MPDHSLSKEISPNIQSEPAPMQPEATASCPNASYLREETNTCPTTISPQAAAESDKVPPQTPLLQSEQPQLLSCSSSDLFSRPLPSLAALLWTRSSTSMSFLE